VAVVIFGSVALDVIEIGGRVYRNVLGGSGTFAALAASLFTKPVYLVWGVGDDFPKEYLKVFEGRVDTTYLKRREGIKTFRWHTRYDEQDESRRETLYLTDELKMGYEVEFGGDAAEGDWLLLATSVPDLQKEALSLWRGGRVVCDTIETWIRKKRQALEDVIRHCWGVCVNEEEARLLVGGNGAEAALGLCERYGLSSAVVKLGRYGAVGWVDGEWAVAAGYPLKQVVDPTGAGDVLAGAVVGYMDGVGRADADALRVGLLFGVAAASFCCEVVGGVEFADVGVEDIKKRVSALATFAGCEHLSRIRRLNYGEEENVPRG